MSVPVSSRKKVNSSGIDATVTNRPFGLTKVATTMAASAKSTRNGKPTSSLYRPISPPVTRAAMMMPMPEPVEKPVSVDADVDDERGEA